VTAINMRNMTIADICEENTWVSTEVVLRIIISNKEENVTFLPVNISFHDFSKMLWKNDSSP
jgi:hypothetical protein